MKKLCPTCGGKGWIKNPEERATSTQIACQTCNYSGWVETDDKD